MKEGFVYTICNAITKTTLETIGPVEYFGLSNIPRQGAFILASNHMSHLDVPLVGASVKAIIYYVARDTLMDHPIMRWLLPKLRAIAIDRDSKGEVRAMKRIIQTAQDGYGILIFPEGTRSPDGNIQPVKNGLGMIACRAGVPIVPARMFGTRNALGKHSNQLQTGVPIAAAFLPPVYPASFDPGPGNPERYAVATERIMRHIAAMRLPEYLAV